MMKKQFIVFIAVTLFILFNSVGHVYAQPDASKRNVIVQGGVTIIEFTKHPDKPVCVRRLPNRCFVGAQCPSGYDQTPPQPPKKQEDYLNQVQPGAIPLDTIIDIKVPGDPCDTFDIDIGVPNNPCRCSGGRCYCWSDRRLKKNIQKIGQLENGLNVYTFNYIWDSALTVGVMADEVRKVKPEAVININGFDLVDYSEILSMPMPQDINEILQDLITQQPR
jgi:Chaperone of endosialidase